MLVVIGFLLSVRVIVAGQGAVAAAEIGNRLPGALWPDHVHVEAHQALAGHSGCAGGNAVGAVARRAGESVLDMPRVLRPTRTRVDVVEVVTLGAESIR